MITNIKIAVSGQIERDTRIAFTYPQAYDPQDAGKDAMWLRALFDPRDARNFNCSKLYAFWSSPQGNYYSMIVPSPSDTRNGRLMISIFVGHNIIRDGHNLEVVLNKLEKLLIPNLDNPHTEMLPDLLSTLVLTPSTIAGGKANVGTMAYRSYSNNTELDKLLGNCDQVYYTRYKRIFFVPSIALPPVAGVALTEVNLPVDVSYYIRHLPNGIKTDRYSAKRGESITLIFDKEGYTSENVKVKLDGTPNDYFTYKGFELIFNAPSTESIHFTRKITLRAEDSYGNSVGPLKIKTMGNSCRMIDNQTIEFQNEADQYDIVLSASDGRSVNVKITPQDLKQGQKTVIFPGGTPPVHRADNTTSQEHGVSAGKVVAIVLGPLAGAYILYAAICGMAAGVAWPFEKSEEVTAEILQEKKDSVQTPQPAVTDANLEIADVDYMKNNDSWTISQLTSPKYSALANYIASGDINSILSQAWFPADKENGYWRQIVSTLQTLREDMRPMAATKLTEMCSGGVIDTPAILNALTNIGTPAPRVERHESAAPRIERPANTKRSEKTTQKASKASNTKTNPTTKPRPATTGGGTPQL